jgi:hypothetical protein
MLHSYSYTPLLLGWKYVTQLQIHTAAHGLAIVYIATVTHSYFWARQMYTVKLHTAALGLVICHTVTAAF